MAQAEPLVSDVTDTARWIAAYRAIESRRPDALFHDPLAERLAAERGMAIAASAPGGHTHGGWGFVARTKVIDDAILDAIARGCDRVLNLAAGLDTRPYRLPLPVDFEWIEADLPPMVAEKSQALADQTARCRLTREAVDLTDIAARAAFLDRALAGATKALVLTEGLVCYLTEDEVRALSDALTRPEIAWWMLEFTTPGVVTGMNTQTNGFLTNAQFKFGPSNGMAFFEDLGWSVEQAESLVLAARRLHRLPWRLVVISYLAKNPNLRDPGIEHWSAVVRLTR